MSTNNNLIESVELANDNQYLTINFKEPLFSSIDNNNYLKNNNFQLYLYLGSALLNQSKPDLVFKDNNSYVIIFSLNREVNGQEILEIQLENVYNSEGVKVNKYQNRNFIQLNKIENIKKQIKYNEIKPNSKKNIQQKQQKQQNILPDLTTSKSIQKISYNYSIDDYLRKYNQEKNNNKNNKPNKKYNTWGSTYNANMNIIQSNPGLAYKLNLIKYNAYIASLYPSFYGNIPKKYSPEYYLSVYDSIFTPNKQVKPL